MRKLKITNRLVKGFVSVLLVLSVMLSLAVPFDLAVFAEEAEAATGDGIYALVYKIDGSRSGYWQNTRIVFQNSDQADAQYGTFVKKYSQFADGQYVDETKINETDPRYYQTYAPWSQSTERPEPTSTNTYGNNAAEFVFRDKIKPKCIAGWFSNTWGLKRFVNLENLDTSECTNMSWAFYGLGSADLKTLDLHSTFDTGNVEYIHRFINSSNLTDVNISGFQLPKVKFINCLISGSKLVNVNISNMDISKIPVIKNYIHGTAALQEIDASTLCPESAYTLDSMFSSNQGLKHITLGSSTNKFKIGTAITLDMPNTYMQNGVLYYPRIDGVISNITYLDGMFSNCNSLESVDFGNCEVRSNSNYQYSSMFKNCYNLTDVSNMGCLFAKVQSNWSWAYRETFLNCSSITDIDLSYNTRNIGSSISIFKGCSSLKKLNFSGIGKDLTAGQRLSTNDLSTLTTQSDIYDGCDELSEVVFSPYYPQKSSTAGRGSNNNYPPQKTWVKVENPNPGDYPDYTDGYSEVNTDKLSSEDLFGNFQPRYAGRWVAEASIILNGNGGTPTRQTIKGKKEFPASFDESKVTAARNGYDFLGWYSVKNDTASSRLRDGQPIDAWVYYACWNEHHYTLKLHGNGGTTVKNNETVTEYIASSDLPYSRYFELSNKLFTKPGSVLTGWNTQVNGNGTEYAAGDSVSRLTEVDGGVVELYAQWHEPSLILHLDANYENAPAMDDINYTLSDDQVTKYGHLPEAERAGYTFDGWYTAADGGTKKTNESIVDALYETLYAHWFKNPTIIFDANDTEDTNAYFEINNSDKYVKHYTYDQNLGVIPTPHNGSSVLDGWYTEKTGGVKVTSSTKARVDNTVYYAHWGYKPLFDTNGGIYKEFPAYTVKDSPNYTIEKLPTLKNTEGFLGWYMGDTLLSDGDTVNLSTGGTIVAKWAPKTKYTVTLYPQGGSLNSAAVNPIQVYAGKAVGELPVPTRTEKDAQTGEITKDYEFLGWYTAPNGGEKKDYTFVPVADTPFYAHWGEKKWKVTFDAGEGSLYYEGDGEKMVANDATIDSLPGANCIINKEIYTLDGWYTDITDETTRLTTSTRITGNADYHAKWSSLSDKSEHPSDELYSYVVKWDTPSNDYATNIGDNLVIDPPNGNSSLSAMLFVEFDFNQAYSTTSGKTLAPYSVKIIIPQHIFRDAAGNDLGTDNITAGLDKVDSEGSAFIYRDDDSEYPGCYVITNNEEIKEGVNQSQRFNITYEISPAELRSINGGSIDENGRYGYEYFNDPVPVRILVDRNNDGIYQTSDPDNPDTEYLKNLGLEVHTKVSSVATKTQAGASFGWNTDWGDEPEDADQYYYITWTLTSTHDNTSSQKFKIDWDESTVHNGTVIYTSTSENDPEWKTSGSFKTTIVTKHHRSGTESGLQNIYNEAILNVEWLSGYKQQYRVSQTAGVYLLPDGERLFEKYNSNYLATGNRLKNGGQDLILNRTGINDLSFDINYCEYKNKDNPVWYDNSKTYSAPARDLTITDGAKNHGDVILSELTNSPDRYDWTNDTNLVLTDNDYKFSNIRIYLTEYDAVKVGSEWSEPYEHTAYDSYGDVQIWIRTEGKDTFLLYKTIHADDLKLTSSFEGDAENASSGIATAAVELPADTVGYQVKHTSAFFATKLFTKVTMRLNSSNMVLDKVKEHVAEGHNSIIKNNATLTVNSESPEDSKDDIRYNGGAFICSYELNIGESRIYAGKNCANKDYVVSTSTTEETPVVIAGWEYNTADNLKLIESGEFNDLLPYNFTVDKNTIFVQRRTTNTTTRNKDGQDYAAQSKNKDNLPSNYYDVTFTENWKDSGRTLMTIRVNTPPDEIATGYNVFYKMKTTLANISANGITQTNHVSFTDTTENQSLPKAKFNGISSFDKTVASYYSDLDYPYTAFSSDTTKLVTPSQYATGIKSTVRSEGEFMFKNVTVGLSSEYTYNITFNNNQPSENIIIYDILVNSLNGKVYEWNGDFRSVDISALYALKSSDDETATLAPRLLYCVKQGDLMKEDLDITKSFWTETMPENKKDIKAIAVDCTKDTKNNDFSLPADSAITFNITMFSPTASDDNDIFTYNETYVNGIINHVPFSNVTLTSVMLHYVDPQFHKTAFPKSGTDSQNRGDVVNKSTIYYNLELKNPDDTVDIHNITVEDLLDAHLTVNGMPKVKNADGVESNINSSPKVSYSVSVDESTGREKFTATVSTLAAGETMTIILPAKVNGEINDPIDNTARITNVNGKPAAIDSETTYHIVTKVHAKIKKVNSKGDGLAGAVLQIYKNNSTNWNKQTKTLTDQAVPETIDLGDGDVTQFSSTNDVVKFELAPGDYILHEVSVPVGTGYKLADDILFTLDAEGITHVNNELVNYVEMVDQPAYKVIFHENKPGGTDTEKQKEFRIYEPTDLVNSKVTHFYDIPEWAGDEYVFAGWYHGSYSGGSYKSYTNPDSYANAPSDFENETFTKAARSGSDPDYHIYAKWIPVGTVKKDNNDANLMDEDYRGFGLAGVQIRNPEMYDSNHSNTPTQTTPGGLRYVTSLSESLLSQIDAVSDQTIRIGNKDVGVEYGYAVGTELNIARFIDGVGNKWETPVEGNYKGVDLTKYKLQYRGKNVNGTDTSGTNDNGDRFDTNGKLLEELKNRLTAENDFAYITNVNCTRGTGRIANDHRNFTQYRLYTLVVTYEGDSAGRKEEKIDARAYLRYYDANGKLRVFYNDYKKNMYYGGCLCSYNQVSSMALQQNQKMLEEQQQNIHQ